MKTLFRLLAVVPLWFLHGAGGALGWLIFLASPTWRRRFVENARQADYSFSQVRAAVAESGRLLAELPRLWFGAVVKIEWEGGELVDRARAAGRGIVFLTPHLGCFEAAARSYAQRFGPVTVLYRPARKAWQRELMDSARERPNLTTAPTTLAGVRQMIKALRAGHAVGLLPDQVPPMGMGVWAPFFGRDAYTMTLSSRLAQQRGAVVLLTWGERLSWGRGYLIHVREWTGEIDADPYKAAAQVNAAMERLVRECPSQYLWGYARYKTPRGDR